MNRRSLISLALGTALLLGACGSDSSDTTDTTGTTGPTAEPGITVEGAWARTSPMMASAGAAYMTLTSSVDDRLTGVAVDAGIAATVELHETVMAGDMGGGMTDAMALWTTAEVGFVDPAVAVSVVHNARPDSPDYDALLAGMVADNSPYSLAGIFAAHAVIRPRETRAWLIRMLSACARRPQGGVSRHRLATWPTSL